MAPFRLAGLDLSGSGPPARLGRRAGKSGTTVDHTSARSSSLLVTADVTYDVCHVLIALLLIGDEGRIVVVIVIKRLVDLDIVLRFGNDGLHLAGILLGIGHLKRDQLFRFPGLRRHLVGR